MSYKNTLMRSSGGSLDIGKIPIDGINMDHLPKGVYSLKLIEEQQGYKLNLSPLTEERLRIPTNIYGNYHFNNLELIMTVYKIRRDDELSTNITLEGDKGSGKTLLATHIAKLLMEQENMPVIIVDSPISGDQLTRVAELVKPATFIFDEFDKVYGVNTDRDSSDSLLGYLSSRHLKNNINILVTNNRLPFYYVNRPERVFLAFKFGNIDSLSDDEFNKVCDDIKLHKELKLIIAKNRKDIKTNLDSLIALNSSLGLFKDTKDIVNRVTLLNGLNCGIRFVNDVTVKRLSMTPFEKLTLEQYTLINDLKFTFSYDRVDMGFGVPIINNARIEITGDNYSASVPVPVSQVKANSAGIGFTDRFEDVVFTDTKLNFSLELLVNLSFENNLVASYDSVKEDVTRVVWGSTTAESSTNNINSNLLDDDAKGRVKTKKKEKGYRFSEVEYDDPPF